MIAALRWLGESGDRRSALQLAVALLWFWMLSGAQDEAQTRGSKFACRRARATRTRSTC